jgi:hypothetical protein
MHELMIAGLPLEYVTMIDDTSRNCKSMPLLLLEWNGQGQEPPAFRQGLVSIASVSTLAHLTRPSQDRKVIGLRYQEVSKFSTVGCDASL